MTEQAKNPSLDGLNELANRDSVDIKPTLLRVMTDLYVQKPVHSLEEERHYTELAERLIDRVDAGTRSVVAGRLMTYPGAPQSIIERLLHKRAPKAAVSAPVEPQNVVAAASGNASLAELSEVFLTADAHDRRMILLHIEYGAWAPVKELPAQAAQESIRRLEMAALNHNVDGFAQEIERTLGIARSMARRLIDDASGEPVLVLSMALGMPSDVLQRVLLCLNPAISHSVMRVYELSTLYEEIEPEAARRMTAIWQATHQAQQPHPTQRPAQHRPQYWEDPADKSQPALPARPAIRWEEYTPQREIKR